MSRTFKTILVECHDLVGAGLALATCLGFVLEGTYTKEAPYYRKINGSTFMLWQTRPEQPQQLDALHIREIGCGHAGVRLFED